MSNKTHKHHEPLNKNAFKKKNRKQKNYIPRELREDK